MTAQTWVAAQPDAALATATRPDAAQPGTTRTGATQHGTIANWAWSLSHLIPGHETMQPFELEQLVMELTCNPQRATRPGPVRRRRSR